MKLQNVYGRRKGTSAPSAENVCKGHSVQTNKQFGCINFRALAQNFGLVVVPN